MLAERFGSSPRQAFSWFERSVDYRRTIDYYRLSIDPIGGSGVSNVAVGALRVVIVLALFGLLFGQVVVIPTTALDLRRELPEATAQSWVFLVTGILALLAGQVAVVAVWKLLTMVRRHSVFSDTAFKHVDLFIWAAGIAAVFALGIVPAVAAVAEADDAPGLTIIGLTPSGMASALTLLMVVMRGLLARSVELDRTAANLQAELDGVI